MSKEKEQSSTVPSHKSCQTNGLLKDKEFHRDTKLAPSRRYDIVDLLIVSLYNAIIFAGGLGLGWLLWCKQSLEEVVHAYAAL